MIRKREGDGASYDTSWSLSLFPSSRSRALPPYWTPENTMQDTRFPDRCSRSDHHSSLITILSLLRCPTPAAHPLPLSPMRCSRSRHRSRPTPKYHAPSVPHRLFSSVHDAVESEEPYAVADTHRCSLLRLLLVPAEELQDVDNDRQKMVKQRCEKRNGSVSIPLSSTIPPSVFPPSSVFHCIPAISQHL